MPINNAISHDENVLHQWIVDNLGMNIPRVAMCPNHQAPFEYIKSAFFEEAGDLVAWAPRGGGKTTLGAVATLLDLLFKPTCQIRILGGSLEQSLRMWEGLCPLLEKVGKDELFDERSRARRVKMKNGALAAVLTQSQRSVRGQRVQKLRCDEVELFDREVWNAAQLVTRSRKCHELPESHRGLWPKGIRARIEALSTMHRPCGLMQDIITSAEERNARIIHWCLLDVLEKCPADRDCKSCALAADCKGTARNAGGFIQIDDAIDMKRRVSRETWESEMLCLRPDRRSCVFPAFSVEKHVGDKPWWDTNARVWYSLGMDFGIRNPFVCLWISHDAAGRVFVVDELVVTGLTLEQAIAKVRASRQVCYNQVFCDPAGSQINRQTAASDINVLRQNGFEVAYMSTRIVDGIDRIKSDLEPASGAPLLRIHPRCRTLIRSLQCYHYKEDHSENPHKDNINDHCIDALRYYYVNRVISQGVARCY